MTCRARVSPRPPTRSRAWCCSAGCRSTGAGRSGCTKSWRRSPPAGSSPPGAAGRCRRTRGTRKRGRWSCWNGRWAADGSRTRSSGASCWGPRRATSSSFGRSLKRARRSWPSPRRGGSPSGARAKRGSCATCWRRSGRGWLPSWSGTSANPTSSLWTSASKRNGNCKRTWRPGARRLAEFDAELEREPERVRAFYEVQATRVEPVGLVYLWPETN